MHFARLGRICPRRLIPALALVCLAPVPARATLVSTGRDTLVYEVEPGDTLLGICAQVRGLTRHFGLNDLLLDVRSANDLDTGPLRIGRRLVIPVAKPNPGPQVAARVRDGAPLRGIYLSGPAAGVSSVLTRVDRFIEAGGNAVVLDAKDIDGALTYRSAHPWAGWGPGRTAPLIPSLDYLLERFEHQGLYVVARLAVFLDGRLGAEHPELVLRDAAGRPWLENGCTWLDPTCAAVRRYNLDLIVELAQAGVNEVQIDYIRFPTNGWHGGQDAAERGSAESRQQTITGFVRAAHDSLSRYATSLSVALFGITAWANPADLALTGQHVPALAGLVDAVYPMVYPSHFEPGFAGRSRPADCPGPVVSAAVQRFVEQVPAGTAVRPWLQAFPYGASHFDSDYLTAQILASDLAGADGWCFWNPSCRYSLLVESLQRSAAAGPPVAAVDLGGAPAGPGDGTLLP